MSINSQILLDTMRIAQEKQRICDAINSKSDVPLDLNPMSGYATAIESLHVVRDVEPIMEEINIALNGLHTFMRELIGELP